MIAGGMAVPGAERLHFGALFRFVSNGITTFGGCFYPSSAAGIDPVQIRRVETPHRPISKNDSRATYIG
ncbi:hypothetical protein [Cupriavidus consociatus]|uniref:hypothetical protein n=1 Tax=Cupriavidus consociatus TaxID=2821357 RepID=UPI001AE566A0|nr:MULTISPECIES: hypothetical protein [unclassified Cupriavidus]MBP0619736.1 hypothetical protein [Cupriavidus sp. LEh25]MDK2656387.1 hypothetical protein [Cupriavidus sp. LEh21]